MQYVHELFNIHAGIYDMNFLQVRSLHEIYLSILYVFCCNAHSKFYRHEVRHFAGKTFKRNAILV